MRRRRLMIKLDLWAFALAWTMTLFFFSGQNSQDSGALSQGVSELILRVFSSLPCSAAELDPIIRKLAHFGVFAVEGFLFGLASMATFSEKAGCIFSAALCAAAAVLNEISQLFAEGRSCEPRDVLIDFGGAALGILAALLLRRRLRRWRQKRLSSKN